MTETNEDRIAHITTDDGKTHLDKAFICLTFDAWAFDNRWDIMNEYGYKANGAIGTGLNNIEKKDYPLNTYNRLTAKGWGSYYYCNSTQYKPANNGTNNANEPTDSVQAIWDRYVNFALDFMEYNGVFDLVGWGASEGICPTGLRRALAKRGIVFARGGDAYIQETTFGNNYHDAIAVKYSFNMDNYNNCINAIDEAIENKYGLIFTTHEIFDKTNEEMTADGKNGYSLNETKFRAFLEHVKPFVEAGKLEFITLDEMYAKYYPNEARDLIRRRHAKMLDYMNNERKELATGMDNLKSLVLSSTDFDDLKAKMGS